MANMIYGYLLIHPETGHVWRDAGNRSEFFHSPEAALRYKDIAKRIQGLKHCEGFYPQAVEIRLKEE